MTSDILTPDELGAAGEDVFQSLCSQARLTCNKSNRDRTGWDFRVEFPLEPDGHTPLDRRMPRACQIQVKSTAGESGTRISATLSSIDRLAKDAAPSALVVFRLRPNGTPMTGYVIHLIDGALARILHRLRIAQAKGRSDLNKMLITFDYLKGRRFKPTAAGMKEALDEIAVDDVASYAKRKSDQLANLGYEEGGGLEAVALLQIESAEHLSRMFSGLAPVKPVRLIGYDRRFGIRIPYQDEMLAGIEEFDLNLPSVGAFDLIIKNGALSPAALFQCEAFVPPPIGVTPLLVIRHPLITMLFHPDRLEMETNGTLAAERHTLDEWTLLLRGLSYLASGTATIELSFRGIRIAPTRIAEGAVSGPNIDQLPRLLEFLERWRRLLDIAGVAQRPGFAVNDIWNAETAWMALDIMFNPTPLARLEFDAISGVGDADELEALYFNSCEFAGTSISYALKAVLERSVPDVNAFTSKRFELLDARSAVIDLDEYGANIANVRGLQIVIDPKKVLMEPGSMDVRDEE
jgi:hypothetical protein